MYISLSLTHTFLTAADTVGNPRPPQVSTR